MIDISQVCFYFIFTVFEDTAKLDYNTSFYFVVGWTEALPDPPVDETPPGPEVQEKIKKRYRKKKTKLEEAFPAYLQVCHLL